MPDFEICHICRANVKDREIFSDEMIHIYRRHICPECQHTFRMELLKEIRGSSEWISIDDRLPFDGQMVWAYTIEKETLSMSFANDGLFFGFIITSNMLSMSCYYLVKLYIIFYL